MDIAEVARRSGVRASTLRYYEERGLLAPVGRAGGRRTYAPTVLNRLALVALGQASGFSLEEIRGMLGADGRPDLDRTQLAAKAAELAAQAARLRAVSRGLRHAAACRAPSHAECPTFQRLLRAAGGA